MGLLVCVCLSRLGKKEDSDADSERFREAFILKFSCYYLRKSDNKTGYETWPRLLGRGTNKNKHKQKMLPKEEKQKQILLWPENI